MHSFYSKACESVKKVKKQSRLSNHPQVAAGVVPIEAAGSEAENSNADGAEGEESEEEDEAPPEEPEQETKVDHAAERRKQD